tara:strand:+ start:206 stop:418 length:213 start_codon:yes stop_codon:yes gene_type:complete
MMEDNTQTVLEKVKCREIVGEILDFGVSQEQIKTIINLLAFELEDRDLMLRINELFSAEIEVEEKPQITI